MAEDEPSAAELIAARPALRAHAIDGLLFEGVALAEIAHAHGTPCWVTGAATVRHRYRRLHAAMGDVAIHFAIKANDQLSMLSVLAAEGAGADAVSIGECRRALRAGIAAARIVFSGVGKTAAELREALALGIGQLNVESEEELHELSALAQAAGRVATVALRVNPDVDAGTLDGITTGRAGDKFGVPYGDAARLYAAALTLPGLSVAGLAVHIGSQVTSMAAFAHAYARMGALVRLLRAQGLPVGHMDCGGGLAIAYRDEPSIVPEAWAGCIRQAFAGLDLRLAIEPGRWLAGPAGLLLASVVRMRRSGLNRPLVILDAGMNDLARPAMYGAWHAILPVGAGALHGAPERCDVAGPVCESSDMFARNRLLSPLQAGELVAILDCGAYGSTMSSTYNARPLAACVMTGLGGMGRFTLTRQRAHDASLWAGETMPA